MIAHGPVEQFFFFFLSQPVEAEPEIFFYLLCSMDL